VRQLSLGLASVQPGRAVVRNTLSHLLSLAQALADVDDTAEVAEVSLDRPGPCVVPNILRCRLRGPRIDLSLALHLDLCSQPPRPAWLAIDGVRADRRVDRDHAFSFVRNGRVVPVADPMEQLVLRFAECLSSGRAASVAAEGEAVRQRLRLYREVLDRLP
jgi:hypothetical protein